jgi:nucleotide-binding universal stress UspA family protein
MFAKILAPVDLGEPPLTQLGLDTATAIAASTAQIRLVNVQSFLPAASADYVPTNMGDVLRQAAEQQVAELAAALNYPQDLVSSALRFGVIYQEILSEADEWGADLIVLGSHRPGMAAYLIGSNASIIVRHANCSVLVARTPDTQRATAGVNEP